MLRLCFGYASVIVHGYYGEGTTFYALGQVEGWMRGEIESEIVVVK